MMWGIKKRTCIKCRGYLEGQGDIIIRLIMGITSVTIWVIGVTNLLTKSPWPSSGLRMRREKLAESEGSQVAKRSFALEQNLKCSEFVCQSHDDRVPLLLLDCCSFTAPLPSRNSTHSCSCIQRLLLAGLGLLLLLSWLPVASSLLLDALSPAALEEF